MKADVKEDNHGLTLRLKWSKTMQMAMQPKFIPMCQDKVIDPVHALKCVQRITAGTGSSPLFLLPSGVSMTLSRLRSVFKELLTEVGLSTQDYSLHSLRRGGCTTSYHLGAKSVDVQRHGLWATQIFWSYVSSGPPKDSTVLTAFNKAIN